MTDIAKPHENQPDQGIEPQQAAPAMHRSAASPALAGKTAKGKDSTGRPQRANASEVSAWKKANKATVAETAKHFNLPPTIAKRWCAVA